MMPSDASEADHPAAPSGAAVTELALEPIEAPTDDWQRLSPWSIPQLIVSGIVKHVQALAFGVPAMFGMSWTRFEALAWQIPVLAGSALGVSAVLQFVFTRYRVTETAIELRRGALFRRRVHLRFERVQNVSIAEPFWFRPLGRANLSIDSAGSANEEIAIPALTLQRAEALRSWLSAMRGRRLDGGHTEPLVRGDSPEAPRRDVVASSSAAGTGERFFTRALRDLVIYGLTNNRAFLVVGAIIGFFWQAGISTTDIVEYLGIDFDVVIGGLSLVRFAILLVLAFILSIGLLALLSVLVSIVSYYGFEMYRTPQRLIVRRGLVNRHEIAIRKSRIQTIRLSQDWLDYLLDRRNVYLEQLTHAPHGQQRSGKRQVMVPSVRLEETAQVTDEVWRFEAVESMTFTPLSGRWFRKYALIMTLLELAAVAYLATRNNLHPAIMLAAVAAWPALIAIVYMTWRRGGLAVNGDLVVARSGTIGINYRIFPTAKLQDIARVQTPLMRRGAVSTLVFMTASSRIKVPYLPSEFARRVVDYCVQAIESRPTSWM